MNELTAIRRHIADLFDQGDIEALSRIYEILNKTISELSVMRALLDPPTNDSEQEPLALDIELPLEMEPSSPAEPKKDFTE